MRVSASTLPVFIAMAPIKATIVSFQGNSSSLLICLPTFIPDRLKFILHPVAIICYWKHKSDYVNFLLDITILPLMIKYQNYAVLYLKNPNFVPSNSSPTTVQLSYVPCLDTLAFFWFPKYTRALWWILFFVCS